MDFVIHCLGMPFNGATIESKSLGGSESAAYYQARELARRGHRVTVFTSSTEEGVWDGVTYCCAGQVVEATPLGDRFEFYARSTPHDVLIVQRHPAAFHGQFASKVNIWQLHDLALHRTAGMAAHNMWQVDAVTCVSKWHKDQVCEVYGFDPEFVHVVPNGVDPALYADPAFAISHEDPRHAKISKLIGERKFLLLYQSRPERGLEHLLHSGGIMDRLRDTNAHLLVCTYDNNPAHMMPYYGLLHRWADALPNVTMLGSLTKPQLAALQKSCDLLVYPTEFEEVSPLRGDAVIDMPGGRETIESLWKQDRKDFWVWSWSHAEKRMVLAKANRVVRTRQNTEMVTIRMRPKAGCKAKCETTLTLTPDHEVMLRDGTYVRADQLKPGVSLMPFGRSSGFGRFKKANGEISKYWYVSRKNLGDRVPEHRYVAEMMLGRKLKPDEIVDHIDSNTSNNDPLNLQVWGSHAEHQADHWQRLEVDDACLHTFHASLSADEMKAIKRKAARTRCGDRAEHVENHVVIAVEHAESADAYCMEVDDTHNFVANGIVVHNCISAMEAMHAGLPMLTSVVGALPETCELVDAGVKFVQLKEGRANEEQFVDEIRDFITDPQSKDGGFLRQLRDKQLKAAPFRTWSAAVDKLEAVVEQCFERRKGTQSAALRHCIEHSDIRFAASSKVTPGLSETATDAVTERTIHEMAELYAFTQSPQAYAAHYAKHCGTYYDSFEDKVIGEDVSGTSRFQGVAQLLDNEIHTSGDELRIMDYGCAHGHYMIPFAKAFPKCRFVGVDVSERAIAAATKWAIRDQVTNVELRVGGQEVFDDISKLCPLVYDEESVQYEGNAAVAKQAHRDLFDIIIAGEVVEHVPDWQALLEKFRSVLKPSGYLIVTTPYGRWEWSGIEAFKTAREHLHHFERQDIVEICGRNETHILYAPANGPDKAGNACGSWVWGVRPREPFGEIDLERKRARLAPRETVSACLIVKDGEKTLRKCIESFIDWVDEVVIAVDPTTKDRTYDVIDQLKADYKWKPVTVIPGLNAIESGFDEARNRSIDPVCGDWILWVDADEEVRNPWNLWKYLRPSQHNAFGFPQVHYSADPDQVLTTDYPCRLFRNRKGIKFFGVVHEHPEVEVGKAIPRSAMRFDVKFLHNGYVDEEVRRARFQRNLPLLHRDMEKHPDRGLNRFLVLRDIAQALMFEHEQTRGQILDGHRERALHGIAVFEQIIEKDPIRMIVDSLKFYSHCVETTGEGFEADVSYRVAKAIAPDLACNVQFKGRFYSKSHYEKLMRKLEQEATRHYDSKYL